MRAGCPVYTVKGDRLRMSRPSFGILGLTRVALDGVELRISANRQREVLVLLLLEAGRVVPKDELTHRLWRRQARPTRTTHCTAT